MFALSCESILKEKEKVQQQQQQLSSSADILATLKEATMENSSYATSYRSTATIVSNVIGCDDIKLESLTLRFKQR